MKVPRHEIRGFFCRNGTKEPATEFLDCKHLALGCLRRADSGLVVKYEARPKPNTNLVSKECAKIRACLFRSLTEISFRSKFRFSFQPTKNHKFKTHQYRYN